MGAWQFFQDEILGMKWLNRLIGNVLSLLGLDIDGRLGGSVQFFLYDVIKITVLLCLLIFVISYIQSYFPPERSKKILGRFHGIGANIISALLGDGNAVLFLFLHPAVHRFYQRGASFGGDFLFLDFLTDGRLGQSCAADECFWSQSRGNLCAGGLGDCRCGRYSN